ncbi:MAG: CocE/NonD family hydrolase [Acidimicrobiales bacterium]
MNGPRPRRLRAAVAASTAALLVATGLFLLPTAPTAAAGSFTAKGSIEQVYTYGHPAGSTVELLDGSGTVLQSGTADTQGAKLFRDLAPGPGYQVREGGTTVSGLTVLDPNVHPDQSFYEATRGTLTSGYQYLTTRDGTKLSINVTFPNDGSSGPWPVVVDYSGYDPSQPGQTPQEAAFYPYLGYVVVGVNLRGTTCSGGAFWFFEDAVRTDGYDVIETLAHQSWSNGNVGMVGISYSGYSQMPVAATHPPHLRAITPLSPFSDGYRGILYPGGILNQGFALNWALEREADAKPSAHTWVKNRISGGDTTCQQNQVMRLQSQKLSAEIVDGRFDEPQYAYLSPGNFASQIEVPTFLETQWQDEQTGGYGAEVATILQQRGTKVHAIFTNGTHVDSLGPEVFMKVAAFVDLYVGQRLPGREGNGWYQNGVADALGPLFGTTITSVPFAFPVFSTLAEGLTWYEAQDPIEIRWENGGVAGKEGQPYATITSTHKTWPPSTVKPERWYLQPDGALAKTAPTVADGDARGRSSYTYDPTSKRSKTFDGSTDAMWTSHPNVHWNPLAEGKALSFTTPAFTGKTPYAGGGSADLWLRSTAADTDLEVTLTEVRPDGKEVYIQSGWQRASRRALDPAKSTAIRPWPTYQAGDAAPLPAGQFVPVRVEIFPFAHLFRAGSKLRVNIEAPGGNQPFWEFADIAGTATNEIAHSAGMPSSVLLPAMPDGRLNFYAPSAAPSCAVAGVTTQSQSMRNQPCRDYLPDRKPTGVAAALQGNQVQLSWQAPPVWASGPALTGYRITVAPTGQVVDVDGTATTATVPLGTTGGPVSFTVAARYGATVAPASDASPTITVPTPTSVTAKAGDASASVTWKAPTSPGATVTGYQVTPYVGSTAQAPTTFASTATTQTVTGLTNGTAYSFRVAAIYGSVGASSTGSDPLVVGAPGAPGFLTVTPASKQATIKWWAPSTNGAPITSYTITPYIGSVAQAPVTFNSAANQQTVTGLTNGTTYTFAVAATNSRGTGAAGTTSAVVVNPTPPLAPTSVTAKSANGSAVLAWKAPTSDGGSPITGYVVRPTAGGVAQAPITFNSTATTQTVTGLTNGTGYTFTVAAVNAMGEGTSSSASAALVVGTPGTPGFLSVVPGNKQATVKWWAPSGNGAPITSYVITPYIGSVAQAPVTFANSANSQVVTGLTNGTTYTFSVVAVNAFGPGPAAMSPAALVSPTAPGAPSSVSAKSGNGSATVSWKAPASDGGSPVTGYRVTPYLGGVAQPAVDFASTTTTQLVSGLTNGGSYTFTVQATNAIGTGAASPASSALVVGTPSTPGFITVVAGAGQVTVKWWAPAPNGAPITSYVITPYVGATAQAPRTFASSANTQVVTGLTPGTTYTFLVVAVNAYGPSPGGKSPAATPT